MFFKFLTFLLSVIIVSRSSNSRKPQNIIDTIQQPVTKPVIGSTPKNSTKNNLGVMFYNSRPFEIISFNKGVTLIYTGPDDTSECKNWKISKEKLQSIINNSIPVDAMHLDLGFTFTPCIVEGQLKQENQLVEYWVNAGSYFYVVCRDTTLIFGNFNKKDRKYFLYAPSE